jgi:hypothetical protein
LFPEKNGPVDSASYAVAMAMRLIYVIICFFCFSLGFGNMVARLTLTIAVVQRLKCKSKFKKELLTTGHDHGRIRKNTFDPLFLICSRLMGFASLLKVFVGVLSAKLVVDSCLNSGFAASFQVFSVVTSLGNKPAKTKHNGNIYKRIVKTNTGVQSFSAGLRHSGPQNHKFDKLVCVNASSSKNI